MLKIFKQMEPIDNIILSHGIKGPRPLRMTSKQYLNDVNNPTRSSLDLSKFNQIK